MITRCTRDKKGEEHCLTYEANVEPCLLDKYKNTVYCNVHTQNCRDWREKYKNVCNKVWNRRCTRNMTDQEITETLKLAEECKRSRIAYASECIYEASDPGHLGAIKKMDNIENACRREISNRGRFIQRERGTSEEIFFKKFPLGLSYDSSIIIQSIRSCQAFLRAIRDIFGTKIYGIGPYASHLEGAPPQFYVVGIPYDDGVLRYANNEGIFTSEKSMLNYLTKKLMEETNFMMALTIYEVDPVTLDWPDMDSCTHEDLNYARQLVNIYI